MTGGLGDEGLAHGEATGPGGAGRAWAEEGVVDAAAGHDGIMGEDGEKLVTVDGLVEGILGVVGQRAVGLEVVDVGLEAGDVGFISAALPERGI